MPMTPETHVNVICSMLYQRGERTRENGVRTFSLRQASNVVGKYCARENVIVTVREVLRADTGRWSVEETMDPSRFLLLQRTPKD